MSVADLAIMARDATIMRGERPFLFADLRSEKGKDEFAGLVATRRAPFSL
jgi:urease accessory protein